MVSTICNLKDDGGHTYKYRTTCSEDRPRHLNFGRLDEDHRHPKRKRFRNRPYQMLGFQLSLVIAVLIINTVCTVVASIFSWNNPNGNIHQGTCSSVKSLNLWLHMAINIMSTAVLGASNYCMQIIVSPTRVDVDRAHRSGRWFDIGVPSWRNLRMIPWCRRCFWVLLGLSSMPLHLLYVHL